MRSCMQKNVAGRLLRSVQRIPDQQGLGILLSGVPGVPAATVVIIGGGVLGVKAARAFLGLGAEVSILDHNVQKLRRIDERFDGRIITMFANEYNIRRAVKFADVLVGAVLLPGQRAPLVVNREMVQSMRPGSVIIDFSIDEGGCIATSRPSTLRDPVYVQDGIIHYCVPNMTSTISRTTSYAITNAALPYLLCVGEFGLVSAIQKDTALARGVNLYQGRISHPQIAAALGKEVTANLFPGGSV